MKKLSSLQRKKNTTKLITHSFFNDEDEESSWAPTIKHRRRFSSEETKILEREYKENSSPNQQKIQAIADGIATPRKIVTTWFQNRRAKNKRKGKVAKEVKTTASFNMSRENELFKDDGDDEVNSNVSSEYRPQQLDYEEKEERDIVSYLLKESRYMEEALGDIDIDPSCGGNYSSTNNSYLSNCTTDPVTTILDNNNDCIAYIKSPPTVFSNDLSFINSYYFPQQEQNTFTSANVDSVLSTRPHQHHFHTNNSLYDYSLQQQFYHQHIIDSNLYRNDINLNTPTVVSVGLESNEQLLACDNSYLQRQQQPWVARNSSNTLYTFHPMSNQPIYINPSELELNFCTSQQQQQQSSKQEEARVLQQ